MPRKTRDALRAAKAVALALCVAFSSWAGSAAADINDATVSSAPYTTSATSVDGMVRVYLASLGTPSTLTITVSGSYSLSTGTQLSNGETLTVGFSSSTGAITLTRAGVKTNMGTAFSLRRHSATGTNGLLIAQARKPANPYPGDLSFRALALSSGGYKLYTVAHVYIENYLYGVLPYEMGSGAPAEALKAQAVAARTYAVRMMASRSGGYYDVADTTSDQTYNGTPSSNSACEAAVNATKGVVLKYGSAYTATYYSTSNGGQTESILNAWGTKGLDYLAVKDDPFDYANPDCVVKKATVYSDCASASNNASLMALLKTKAVAGLKAAGYGATAANTALVTLKSVTAHTPMYASPSRLYTKLDFTLTASTQTTAGASATASVTVTCDIFAELESMLSMSIQSGKNELWSVAAGTGSFSLQARRYGHGLGMSQRGAMYMGKLGYTYDQILGFYFAGSSRVGCTFTNTILAAGSTELITTQESAADVEQTADGGATAVVKLVSSSGVLAIRAAKSTSAAMLGVAANASPVTVYASDGTWCLIGYGKLCGYVPNNALTITGTPPETSSQAVSTVQGFATVTANGYLNLRASGSYSASILTTSPSGAVLTVFSQSGGWAYVQYGATAAYACDDFLSFSSTYAGAVASTGATGATVTADSGAVVYLRDAASTSATVLASLTPGVSVTVTRDDGSWAYVTVSGQSGYLPSANLTYLDETTATTGDTDTDTDSDETTATVSATVAYLRVSADESAAMIMQVAMGQSVVLLGRGETWCAVRYKGASGYILTASLSLPPETETAVTATVSTASGSLNLRREADAGSAVLTAIPRGASVTVTSRGSVWSAVTYAGYSGYAMTAYLTFAGDSTAQADDDTQLNLTSATVTTESGSLNLRAQPKAGSAILRTIPQFASVSVKQYGAQWCGVSYESSTGYVMTAFLTFAAAGDTATATPTLTPTPTPTAEASPTASDTAGATDSVTPTPTPTQAASAAGALTAIVSTASGSLNLRADMLPGSRILARIPKGSTITVSQKLEAWSETTYAGYTGYVMNAYLTFPADASTAAAQTSLTATVLTASGSLNLRAEPYGTVLAAIPQYAAVTVLSTGSTWCYVSYAGTLGYVMTAYLSMAETTANGSEATATPTPTPSPSPTPAPGSTVTATVVTASGSLNLRASASTSGQIITTIPRLATVTVLALGDPWSSVLYGSYAGYVQTAYLSVLSADATATASASPTATPAVSGGVTAWVYTASGSLNLRVSASTSAAILAAMPRLAQVTLLTRGDTWSAVQYQSLTGYAMTAYLTTVQPSELSATATPTAALASATPTPTPSPAAGAGTEDATLQAPSAALYAVVAPPRGGDTYPLWAECTQERGRLLDMIAGAQVQVVRKGDTWCEVLYFELTGYCLTEGLTILAQ